MNKLVRVGDEFLVNVDEILSVRYYPKEGTTWVTFIIRGDANDFTNHSHHQQIVDPNGLLFDEIRSRCSN
jgi:hypothetical protein